MRNQYGQRPEPRGARLAGGAGEAEGWGEEGAGKEGKGSGREQEGEEGETNSQNRSCTPVLWLPPIHLSAILIPPI